MDTTMKQKQLETREAAIEYVAELKAREVTIEAIKRLILPWKLEELEAPESSSRAVLPMSKKAASPAMERKIVDTPTDPSAGTTTAVSPKDRTVEAIISTSACDLVGDSVLPGGMDAEGYMRNAVVLFQHEQTRPVGVVRRLTRTDRDVRATIEFNPRPKSLPPSVEWAADTLLELYASKRLKGWSIGFMPLEVRGATDADKRAFGPDTRRIITRWRLLELSAVAVPCQPEALSRNAPPEPAKARIVIPAEPKRVRIVFPK